MLRPYDLHPRFDVDEYGRETVWRHLTLAAGACTCFCPRCNRDGRCICPDCACREDLFPLDRLC